MARQANISTVLHDHVTGILRPGEKTLWTGRPNSSRVANRIYWVYVISLPVLFFGIAQLLGALGDFIRSQSALSMQGFVVSVAIVFVGVGVASIPAFVKNGARRTAYYVSNQRVIVVRQRINGRTEAVSIVPLNGEDLDCVELSDGSGDLVFLNYQSSELKDVTNPPKVEFVGVRDVRAIERLVWATFFESRNESVDPSAAALSRVRMHL